MHDYDDIASDRLERTSLDDEHEASELETIRQHYAELVRLRKEVKQFCEKNGAAWLVGRYIRFANWFEDHAVHSGYRALPERPLKFYGDDADRESIKLYGTEKEWADAVRAEREGRVA